MKTIKTTIILILLLLLTGCTNKTAITAEEFKKISKEENLKVKDVELTVENGQKNEDIKEAVYATSKKGWTLEYYIAKDEKTAKKLYKDTKEIFKSFEVDMSTTETKQKENYEVYTLTTQTAFYHVCRVEDTLLTINANDKNEDQISKVIKKLGYEKTRNCFLFLTKKINLLD